MTTEQLPDWGDDTMRFTVQQALPVDRKAVEQLVKACGKQVRSYFDYRALDNYWLEGHVWAMMLAGVDQPVGFAVVYPQIRKPVLSLYELGIHPEWRRFGLGTKLMQAIWGYYTERLHIERLRLVVNESNKVAIDVYRKWGLEAIELKETKKNGQVLVMEGQPWS